MIHVIVGGLIEKNGKFLLVQEAKEKAYKKWNIPAGRLEEGETVFDGAKREIFEETGCEVEIENILNIGNKITDKFTIIFFHFKTKLINDNISFNKEEILDVKWFSYDEIINMKENLRSPEIIMDVLNNYKESKEIDKSIIKVQK